MNFNEQQNAVICSEANKILCLAGAGTGKTACMIGRITQLVDSGYDPYRMLVLTFTNAAAFEMKRRYIDNRGDARTPEFRTFHSFCYSLICKDIDIRTYLGFSSTPSICDDVMNKFVEEKAKLLSNVSLSSKKLSGKCALTLKEQREFDIYQKCLKRVMVQDNLITFDYLCYEVCKLFEDKNDLVSKYLDFYEFIFVDEFQDTDDKQYRFVKSFENSKLFAVADALQAIYAFRGADSSIVKKLAVDPEWTVYKLYKNYRSGNNICTFANQNSLYADTSYRIEIQSDKMTDVVEEFQSNGFSRDTVDIANIIDNDTYTSLAILARTNKEVEDIKNCLSIDDSKEVDTKLWECIIRASLDYKYWISWLCSLLDPIDFHAFMKYESELSVEYSDMERQSRRLDILHSIVSNRKYENTLYKYDCYILGITSASVSSLLTYIQSISGLDLSSIDSEVNSSTKLLRRVLEYVKSYDSNNPSVYVGTIHSSKGLEYDTVILYGVGGKTFPLTSEENRNLYYVGITRARNHLIVFKEK